MTSGLTVGTIPHQDLTSNLVYFKVKPCSPVAAPIGTLLFGAVTVAQSTTLPPGFRFVKPPRGLEIKNSRPAAAAPQAFSFAFSGS